MESDDVLLPGQPLASNVTQTTLRAGEGTFQRSKHILSSIIGQEHVDKQVGHVTSKAAARFIVPHPGAIILGRVTRVTPRQANVSILVVNGQPIVPGDWSACGYTNHAAGEDPTGADFTGVIRTQDVRATEKDKIRMGDCFRPGDIVRASVISLGDARSYYLSTASNPLGVVYAMPSTDMESVDGKRGRYQEPLVPISWQEMRDPASGKTEKRKVAKPDV